MVGVDEVGRGCLAGPLLVVAARANMDLPNGLKDSKILTRLQREEFYKTLSRVCDYGEGWVSADEINRHGLAKSLQLGFRRAVRDLGVDSDEEIIQDGIISYLPKRFLNARCEARADNNYPIVSAASIYAKVTRDSYMQGLAQKYPNYMFERHVGYGTTDHRNAIQVFGVLKHVHRTVFATFQGMV